MPHVRDSGTKKRNTGKFLRNPTLCFRKSGNKIQSKKSAETDSENREGITRALLETRDVREMCLQDCVGLRGRDSPLTSRRCKQQNGNPHSRLRDPLTGAASWTILAFGKGVKQKVTAQPSISTPRYLPKRSQTCFQKDSCMNVHKWHDFS